MVEYQTSMASQLSFVKLVESLVFFHDDRGRGNVPPFVVHVDISVIDSQVRAVPLRIILEMTVLRRAQVLFHICSTLR